jgi:hypothetical protein
METVGRDTRSAGGFQPKRVFWIIAAALLLAVFLNASELEREAKQKPIGGERDFWIAVWKPFAVVSQAVYLDKPREWADEALGRDPNRGVFELPGATPPAADTPPAEPKLRTPTEDDPLRLWVGGDSMSKVLGEAVVRQALESDLIEPTHQSELQTGLARPDYFDWPREFDDLAKEDPPFDVFVVMFGANDAQGLIEPNGTIHQDSGTPGWKAEYRRRVGGVMDLLRADGRLVVWVGQPIMRDDWLSEQMDMMNVIYREEAETRPWVKYLDTWVIFADEDGQYTAYLEVDGEDTLVRNPDGVHFVREGGEIAAEAILDLVLEQAGIEERAVAEPVATPGP